MSLRNRIGKLEEQQNPEPDDEWPPTWAAELRPWQRANLDEVNAVDAVTDDPEEERRHAEWMDEQVLKIKARFRAQRGGRK